MLCNIILFLLSIFDASAERILHKSINPKNVQTVFVVPGKPLLIEYPCDIKYALPGTKTDLEIKVGVEKKNNITFWAHSMSDVIGINIMCGEHLLVYDVIPHKHKYQNYIRVTDLTFTMNESKRRLISSSENASFNENQKPKNRKLISEGTLFKSGRR